MPSKPLTGARVVPPKNPGERPKIKMAKTGKRSVSRAIADCKNAKKPRFVSRAKAVTLDRAELVEREIKAARRKG